jgi:23S rRNA pseudouridine955/2504/2580 synthase
VRVDPEGKSADSVFTVTERFSHCSLVDVELLTGRTHQIRVHAAAEHHPVAGDEKYGDRDFNREMKQLGLKRMFLHARKLAFDLDTHIEITAPLDENLVHTLEMLRSENE